MNMEIPIELQWFKNAIQVTQCNNGWRIDRFTKKQLESYAALGNNTIHARSLCSAGVMLDLKTNSQFLQFHYHVERSHDRHSHFDVYLNDQFVCSKPVQTDGLFHFNLQEDANNVLERSSEFNRISVYFPHYAEIHLHTLVMAEASITEPTTSYPRNLLVVGSSSTQGRNAKHPSSSFGVILSRFLGMNLLNQGVGSYYFDQNSLDPDLPYSPDLITVQYGSNDWGKWEKLDIFRERCEAYMEKLVHLYPKATILMMTPHGLNVSAAKPMGTLKDLIQVMKETGARYPTVHVIEGTQLIPRFSDFFEEDRVHPTDAGFLHMALNIIKFLQTNRIQVID